MKYDAAVLREWIDALAAPKKTLTKWESDFVESISDQLTMRGWLSDAQIDKLEQIYADKA